MTTEKELGYFDDDVSDLPEWKQQARYTQMGVDNTGLLVQRAYRDGLPMQFNRELLKNAFEAGATIVRIGPDWLGVEDGAYRYVCSDNGKGMSGEELVRFFNKLSSSGKAMDEHGNFGMGAKIALLPWNQSGLVVMSWKRGIGSMVRIARDTSTGNYALLQWREDERSDRFRPYIEAPEEYKPTWIGESGTLVLCLGNGPAEDTYMGPELKISSAKIHREALNNRFFEMPSGVDVKVYEFATGNKEGWPKQDKDASRFEGWQTVLGSKHYLDRAALFNGISELSDVRVHWWVMKPMQKKGSSGDEFRSRVGGYAPDAGFVAALYDGELYDMLEGMKARSRHQQFGVIWDEARKNITLIVEPKPRLDGERPAPDTSRRTLLYGGGEELPWVRWGEEFIAVMPQPVREELARREPASSVDGEKIAERLKEYLDRYQFLAIKPAASGSEPGEPGAPGGDGQSDRNVDVDGDRPPRRKRRSGRKFLAKNPDGLEQGTPITPRLEPPRPIWDESDTADDSMRGRAAEYIRSTNTLRLNWRFSVFQEAFDFWCKRYEHSKDAPALIKTVVQEVYALELMSRVFHAFAFEGRVGWQEQFLEESAFLSSEALTLAALGVIGVEHAINTKLGGKLKGLAKRPGPRGSRVDESDGGDG